MMPPNAPFEDETVSHGAWHGFGPLHDLPDIEPGRPRIQLLDHVPVGISSMPDSSGSDFGIEHYPTRNGVEYGQELFSQRHSINDPLGKHGTVSGLEHTWPLPGIRFVPDKPIETGIQCPYRNHERGCGDGWTRVANVACDKCVFKKFPPQKTA